jgi:hypothetical protein
MDGWDAAVKVSALAVVLTLAPVIAAVARAGVGSRYRLVCQAEKLLDGTVVGSVKPELVPTPALARFARKRGASVADEPLAGCDGATSIILFQMDVIHGLTLSEIHPDAVTTAYGPLAASRFIAIARAAPSPPAVE